MPYSESDFPHFRHMPVPGRLGTSLDLLFLQMRDWMREAHVLTQVVESGNHWEVYLIRVCRFDPMRLERRRVKVCAGAGCAHLWAAQVRRKARQHQLGTHRASHVVLNEN
ncbi:hypothetical protein [Pontibacter sp. G13]|uniref:hypothetical protein n=1 Tax=Pontibacter sp. G13 TaxID=3074898 RepID=UPI00288BC6C1|nr:hypothetical protein [Pontibacter sp. G13]WNJ21592.1 hypothetical protein RJD25_29070 [Pontibacter sp. G13]